MTGRGLGYCAGHAAPGYVTPGYGYGYGRGAGGYGGRGWRHVYYATGLPRWARGTAAPAYWPAVGYPARPAPRDEAAALKAEAEYLESVLEETKSRLARLETETDE